MEDEVLANRIKSWRNRRNITQKELAEKLGVKQPYISSLESISRYSILKPYLHKIMDIYPNVDESDLVKVKPFVPEQDKNMIEIELKYLKKTLEETQNKFSTQSLLNDKFNQRLSEIRRLAQDILSKPSGYNMVSETDTYDKKYQEVLNKIITIIETPITSV